MSKHTLNEEYLVEDWLKPGLKLVFCGTALGHKSAEAKAYYAHPGNRFWGTLADLKFTDRKIPPLEFRDVWDYGIGLTDMCKTNCGMDKHIKDEDYDRVSFEKKILKYQPQMLAFTSLTAASVFFFDNPKKGGKLELGLQKETIGKTRLFICASTSGGNGHWKNQKYSWDELAKLFARL